MSINSMACGQAYYQNIPERKEEEGEQSRPERREQVQQNHIFIHSSQDPR